MRIACHFGAIIVLLAVTTVVATERPLEGGYFKWLLHLGQSPSDRINHVFGHRLLDENPQLSPAPGDFVYFGDECCGPDNRPATQELMIWTPQYSETGIFAAEGYDDSFTQYYHIYINSSQERAARLRFRKYRILMVRNNGEEVCNVSGLDGEDEGYVDFTLWAGVNSMTFKVAGPAQGSVNSSLMSVRITDCNDADFSDLTYSLEPLEGAGLYVIRHLGGYYNQGSTVEVDLDVSLPSSLDANEVHIIEYLPQGTSVEEAGGADVVHNTLWWTVKPGHAITERLQYKLRVSPQQAGPLAFSGYMYWDKQFVALAGDKALFPLQQTVPAEMSGSTATIKTLPRITHKLRESPSAQKVYRMPRAAWYPMDEAWFRDSNRIQREDGRSTHLLSQNQASTKFSWIMVNCGPCIIRARLS